MKELKTSNNLWRLAAVLFIIAIFFFIKHVYQYQLGGYDLGPLVDLTHRLSKGETPGTDFINTFPLSLLFWIKLNQFFFKNNWNFLFYSNFTHFLICISFCYLLLRNNPKIGSRFKFAFLLVMAVPIIITNHIWHSTFSQYNCIVVFISVANIILNKKIKTLDYIVFLLFSGFLLFSKQNIGVFAVALFALSLLICYIKKFITARELLLAACAFLVSSVVYVLLIKYLLGMEYYSFIQTYTSVAGRGIPTRDQLRDVFKHNTPNFILLISLVLFSGKVFFDLFRLKSRERNLTFFIYFNLGLQIIGYYSFFTNWDIKFNDLVIITISNLFLLEWIDRKNFTFKIVYSAVLVLFIVSLVLGAQRYRMLFVGARNNYFDKGKLFEIKNGYLQGLNVGSRLTTIIQELDTLKASGAMTNNVFFGPRMEFLYAQYDLKSPPKMPLWWHPGSSYSLKDEALVVQRFKDANFNVLVFLNRDRSRMPPAIISYINGNYSPVPNNATLDIYKKK